MEWGHHRFASVNDCVKR